MRTDKMLRVCTQIASRGYRFTSDIYSTSNGEIIIGFVAQPTKSMHDYLMLRGFVVNPQTTGEYIYRP